MLDRTRLIDSHWTVVQRWTSVPVAWITGYLATKFVVEIKKAGPVVFVLAQLDGRYFRGLEGKYTFDLHFVLQKEGSSAGEYLVRASNAWFGNRSISAEIDLEPGRYEILPKVVATRDATTPDVYDVVTKVADRNPQKLRQIGMNYDIANAKGVAELTEEEKKKKEEDRKAVEEKEQKEKEEAEKEKAEFEAWKKEKREKEEKEKSEKEKSEREKSEREKSEKEKSEKEKTKEEQQKREEDKKSDAEIGSSQETHSDNKHDKPQKPEPQNPEVIKGTHQKEEENIKTTPTVSTESNAHKIILNSKDTSSSQPSSEDIPPEAPEAPQTVEAHKTSEAPRYPEAPEPPTPIHPLSTPSSGDLTPAPVSPVLAPTPPPADPEKPAQPQTQTQSNEPEAPKKWNAICVLGLRVYSHDPDVSITLVKPGSEGEAAKPLVEAEVEGNVGISLMQGKK